MTVRDPTFMTHTPVKLRWYAARFQEKAAKLRVDADALDKKAARYTKRADKLDKVKI